MDNAQKAISPSVPVGKHPTLVSVQTVFRKGNQAFLIFNIPALLQVLVMVRCLIMNDYIAEVLENTVGGMPAVLAMDMNGLYNRVLSLFDVTVECTSNIALLLALKCTSLSTSAVKTYVDEFFKLLPLCQSLMGDVIPDQMARVMLVMGCPAKLRKAIIKNPALRTLEQTKNQILLQSGPVLQSLTNTTSRTTNDPMELDVATQDRTRSNPRGPLSPEERRRRSDSGACMYCGEQGHIANTCPALKARDNNRNKRSNPRAARFNNAEEAVSEAQGNE